MNEQSLSEAAAKLGSKGGSAGTGESKRRYPWQATAAAQKRWHNRGVVFPAVFWSQVEVGDVKDCWPWKGELREDGYASIILDQEIHYAHRMAYLLTYGEIPFGLCVLHKCDNRACCNPLHHFTGTIDDNNKDRMSKGRSARNIGTLNGRVKLTEADVRYIREACASGTKSQKEIAEELGISRSSVSFIISRRNWKHVP